MEGVTIDLHSRGGTPSLSPLLANADRPTDDAADTFGPGNRSPKAKNVIVVLGLLLSHEALFTTINGSNKTI